MDPQAPPQYHNAVVDPNCVPRPYSARTDHLPTKMDDVNAEWLGRMMAYKYPGVVARSTATPLNGGSGWTGTKQALLPACPPICA